MKGIKNRQNTLLGRKLFTFTIKPDLSNKKAKSVVNFIKDKSYNHKNPSSSAQLSNTNNINKETKNK